MRYVAGLAMIVFAAMAGSSAGAQSLAPSLTLPPTDALAAAPFADTRFDLAGRPIQWQSSEVALSPRSSLRVTLGESLAGPGGLPLHLNQAAIAGRDVEVALTRAWPRALSFEGERFDIDLSPHAGLGVGNRGGSAEAGAELRLESRDDKAADRLRDLGIKDGSSFGDAGRWYLFAAASGRAVGLNMLRDGADWDRAGWSTDPTSALIGDAHVGVGYRKGAVQTSFGVIHREVKGQHMVFGQETKDDTIAAFSLTIRPRK